MTQKLRQVAFYPNNDKTQKTVNKAINIANVIRPRNISNAQLNTVTIELFSIEKDNFTYDNLCRSLLQMIKISFDNESVHLKKGNCIQDPLLDGNYKNRNNRAF